MLKDDSPATWDTDDYIREWVRQRGGDRQPVCYVPLLSVTPGKRDVAVIHFGVPGHPVTRSDSLRLDDRIVTASTLRP